MLTGLLFGSSLIVARYAVGQMDPTTFVWLRLAISSAAFVVVYAVSAARGRPRRPPTDRTLWRDGAILGIFSTAIPMVGTIASLRYLSAGVTALLLTISPAVVVLLAHFLLPDERLTPRKSAGIGLALAGAALLVLRGESGLPGVAGSPIGYALALGAILIDSLMIIYTRRHCADHDTFDLSAARTLVAVLAVAPLSLLFVGFDLSAVTRAGAAGLFYSAAAATFGGLMLFLWVNQRFGATAASLSSYVLPVVAAVGGVLFLGERITPVMAAGTALIVGGIVVLNRPEAAAAVFQAGE
ncbi:MAG TPA: DMT family transporter [Promineifilum sp.]|nr:DMT family transporter [Promineifilum sp.]